LDDEMIGEVVMRPCSMLCLAQIVFYGRLQEALSLSTSLESLADVGPLLGQYWTVES